MKPLVRRFYTVDSRCLHMKGRIVSVAKKQGRSTPFPVVEMRFDVRYEGLCVSAGCGKQSAYALAGYGGGLERYQSLLSLFSQSEANELAWEQAFRMQQRGEEVWSQTLALCPGHAQGIVEMYLGSSYAEEINHLLLKAVMHKETIFLYDRNMRRDMHHPSIAVGPFQTIADFRRMLLETRP